MQYIYLIDYRLAGDFFLRLANAAKDGGTHHFITTVHSVAALARSDGHSVSLLTKFGGGEEIEKDLTRTREVVLGILSKRRAASLYSKAFKEARASVLRSSAQGASPIVMVWNGAGVLGEVARALKTECGCRTLFFEISNLPGKIFVDPDGVNAQSRLYRTPSILDQFPGAANEFERWRREFIASKRKSAAIPQARTARALHAHHVTDFLFGLSLGYRSFSWSSVRDKLKGMVLRRRALTLDAVPRLRGRLPERYIFFPMQVSNDTQIVLNSDVDNLGALRILAKNAELPIVIKPHPAEAETGYIHDAIRALKFRCEPLITDENTIDLIEKSDRVVTINSTVGLEAIILGKRVEFLAKSFYAKINERNLPNYVMGYLVDVDFFAASVPVSRAALFKIRERADI